MNNLDLVTKALNVLYNKDKWTYLGGAIGHLAESDRARGLYNYIWNQPEHGGSSMTKPYNEWLIENIGKQCTDCNNFINYLLGYTYSQYSTGGLATMKRFEGDKKDAPLGTVLCLIGNNCKCTHVGLVIGKDTFMDFYAYNNTCRTGKISESLFTYAVYLPNVSYTDRTPTNLQIKLTDKPHYVGDKISKDDFVVSYIDDVGIIADTKEYMFAPDTYYNTANTVAIVYHGIKEIIEYVVVPADSLGKLYVVQIPCEDREQALKRQSELIKEGYNGTSVIVV